MGHEALWFTLHKQWHVAVHNSARICYLRKSHFAMVSRFVFYLFFPDSPDMGVLFLALARLPGEAQVEGLGVVWCGVARRPIKSTVFRPLGVVLTGSNAVASLDATWFTNHSYLSLRLTPVRVPSTFAHRFRVACCYCLHSTD